MSFNINKAPDDATLGECKSWFMNDGCAHELIQLSTRKQIGIRFMLKLEQVELPDEMMISTFRILVDANRAFILIDDSDGGVKSRKPELV